MTYAGTAGAMLDFSAALGLRSSRSSFSRNVFSLETILLEVIFVCFDDETPCRDFSRVMNARAGGKPLSKSKIPLISAFLLPLWAYITRHNITMK